MDFRKHTIKATESRTRVVTTRRGDDEGKVVRCISWGSPFILHLAGLPRAASWAQKGSASTTLSMNANSTGTSTTSRQARRQGAARQPKSIVPSLSNDSRSSQSKGGPERKISTTLSHPSTPIAGNESVRSEGIDSKVAKHKESLPSPGSPVPSTTTTSDLGFVPLGSDSEPSRRDTANISQLNERKSTINSPDFGIVHTPPGLAIPPGLAVPPGLPQRLSAPRGLSTPPGIPMANRLSAVEADTPKTPLLASQSSYQISTAALALLEDVKARRGSSIPVSPISPFPDFDRTLQTLSGEDGGGFSFNLDLKLAEQVDTADELPELNLSSNIPFRGSYMDAFPALRSTSSQLTSSNHALSSNNSIYDPSISDRRSGHQVERSSNLGPCYVGSFNPFSDPAIEIEDFSSTALQQLHHSPVDEERKMSRFGFARGRQTSTAASSPLPSVSPLSYSGDQHLFYQTINDIQTNPPQSWQQNTSTGHFTPQHAHQATQGQSGTFLKTPNQLSSLNGGLSESQFRNFILSSHEQVDESINMTQVTGTSFYMIF